jgi:hypothetical protein
MRAQAGDADAAVVADETAEGTAGTRERCDDKASQGGPRASLTDPEAVLMLATSEKRWQPSYNADLAVTRHGVIISQFLTKHPTDYHNFAPALGAVLSTLGRPEGWIGDGHYGTQANLLLAHREGVVLYAPSPPVHKRSDGEPSVTSQTDPSPRTSATKRFNRVDFQCRLEDDVMLCPAGEELHWIGTYPNAGGRGSYRLYGRRDCTGCLLKAQCTRGRRRRLKVPVAQPEYTHSVDARDDELATSGGASLGALVEALEKRMQANGDQVLKFRGQTIEPVHAQIKQHGVGRFHVRGLPRSAVVLALACIAHNLMKWKARETAFAMRLAA